MYTRLNLTIPTWIYQNCLSKSKNKSALVAELIIKGFDAELSELSNYKQKTLQLIKELNTLKEQNENLKRQLGRFKGDLSNNEKMATAYKNRGLWS